MGRKRILVVGAGEWQLPAIRKAQEMGLEVIATDRNPNAPGFQVADHAEQVDIADLAQTLQVAQRYRVDAVMTDQTDLAVPTVAYVADQMGLVGIGYEVAIAATNKQRMRERCHQAGVPIPNFRTATSYEEARAAAEAVGLPVILKPVDSQASRGVSRLENLADLERQFESALNHSRLRTVLVEEWLEGTEVTVEGFVSEGTVYSLTMSDKVRLPPQHCIDRRLVYPADISEEISAELSSLNTAAVNAIGITMGMTHAEFIVTAAGSKFLELAARGGGSRISSHIVPAVTGVEVIELLLKQLLGERAEVKLEDDRSAILEFIVPPPGRLASIAGMEEAGKLKDVLEVRFELRPGDEVPDIDDGRKRPGFFVAVGNTRGEVLETARKLKEIIRIEVEPLEGKSRVPQGYETQLH